MLMTFLGCIGSIIDGSGLEEVLSRIYATKAVKKMLDGHAYSIAMRGHFLMYSALMEIIMNEVELPENARDDIKKVTEHLEVGNLSTETIVQFESVLLSIGEKVNRMLTEFRERGATSQLWVQYFDMITTVKNFIRAERMGDWKLHLTCVQRMIPYFHGSEHFPLGQICASIFAEYVVT